MQSSVWRIIRMKRGRRRNKRHKSWPANTCPHPHTPSCPQALSDGAKLKLGDAEQKRIFWEGTVFNLHFLARDAWGRGYAPSNVHLFVFSGSKSSLNLKSSIWKENEFRKNFPEFGFGWQFPQCILDLNGVWHYSDTVEVGLGKGRDRWCPPNS